MSDADEVRSGLQAELQSRLRTAGIDVLETRLTHLAYAPEIAEVMLRRQQAEAILAARRTMVQGAVGLVQQARRAGRLPHPRSRRPLTDPTEPEDGDHDSVTQPSLAPPRTPRR